MTTRQELLDRHAKELRDLDVREKFAASVPIGVPFPTSIYANADSKLYGTEADLRWDVPKGWGHAEYAAYIFGFFDTDSGCLRQTVHLYKSYCVRVVPFWEPIKTGEVAQFSNIGHGPVYMRFDHFNAEFCMWVNSPFGQIKLIVRAPRKYTPYVSLRCINPGQKDDDRRQYQTTPGVPFQNYQLFSSGTPGQPHIYVFWESFDAFKAATFGKDASHVRQ